MQEKGSYSMYSIFVFIVFIVLGVAPVPAYAYTQSDVAAFKEARQGRFSALQNLAQVSNDPLVRSTAQWVLLRGNKSDFNSLKNFIGQHPDWPSLSLLKQKAEEKMPPGVSDRESLNWFQKNKPETYNGTVKYIGLLKGQNNLTLAKTIAKDFWQENRMSRDQQREFYSAYGSFLSQSDHEKRIRFLFNGEQYEQAQAVANVIGGEYSSFIDARIKLAKNDNGVNQAISNISPRYANHPDLLYERLKWRRKNDMNSGAIEILNKEPPASQVHDPAAWWQERHIIIRRLLEEKNYQKAYQLASSHKQKEGFPLAQAEFVAGWIALRFVNKPYEAFEHFERLYNNVETPISRSRGAYWAGRASETLGDNVVASQWYAVAAQYPETFYGQLAAEKTPAKEVLLIKTAPTVNSSAYYNDKRTQAAKLLNQAGMDEESRLFLFRLLKDRTGQNDLITLAQFSRDLGYEDITIKVAQEIQEKHNKTYHDYLYPRRVKDVQNVRNTEWALIHAIIRQESRFDQKAISPAGARGLMQLMPATAKETARQNGLSHDISWLTTRSDHNIQLGSKYIGQLVRRFDGNYAMAAAGYNAGPNRVDRWKQENGNPQNGQVDLVDWIELIPIYETRNYVQRVLEGVYVYRQYLKGVQAEPKETIHLVAK